MQKYENNQCCHSEPFALNADGTVAWQRTYGRASYDGANSIRQTTDGGYIVAGSTYSFGAGSTDAWVLKLDSNGNIPTCGARGTSSATVTNTGVTGINTAATVANTGVAGSNTTATVADTAVTPTQVCYAAGPTNPQVFLSSNQASYVTGSTLVLSAAITPGTQNYVVDGYVKVVIPGGPRTISSRTG